MATTTTTAHHGWALLLLWCLAWVILGLPFIIISSFRVRRMAATAPAT